MAYQKIGLTLEGGGVKGAYEAGILSALDEKGATFDGVAGTSIGAVNGALYVQGGVKKVEDMWSQIWAGTIVDVDEAALKRVKEHGIDLESAATIGKSAIKMRSLLRGSYDKTQAFFAGLVDEKAIRASGKQFGFVTYCLTDRQPVEALMDEVPEGQLVDYVIASATFPLFPPKEIGGKKYIDGGVYNNIPVNLLARGGFERQLVLRTNPADKKLKIKEPFRDDLELFFILPDEELAHVMDFTSAKVTELLERGREDAHRALEYGLAEFLGL